MKIRFASSVNEIILLLLIVCCFFFQSNNDNTDGRKSCLSHPGMDFTPVGQLGQPCNGKGSQEGDLWVWERCCSGLPSSGEFRAGHEPTRKFAGPKSLRPCKVKLLRDGALLGRSQLLTPGLRWRNLQMVW